MTHSQIRVLNSLIDRIEKSGAPNNWYVGICSDPHKVLTNIHKVNISGSEYFFDRCQNSSDTAEVAGAIMNKLGIDGFIPQKISSFETFIYVFKMNENTIPSSKNEKEEEIELAEV